MKDNLNCPICLDLLNSPVECTTCSGTVCKKCWQTNGNTSCALCRSGRECKPSLNIVKFLDLLKFTCKNKGGCEVESVYSNVLDHMKSCRFVSYPELVKINQ